MDFALETPKFRFEFCRGFFGGFFPPFFQGKRPEKSTKKSPANSPRTLFGKIPLGFLQKPFLEKTKRCELSGLRVLNWVCDTPPPSGAFPPDFQAEGSFRTWPRTLFQKNCEPAFVLELSLSSLRKAHRSGSNVSLSGHRTRKQKAKFASKHGRLPLKSPLESPFTRFAGMTSLKGCFPPPSGRQ